MWRFRYASNLLRRGSPEQNSYLHVVELQISQCSTVEVGSWVASSWWTWLLPVVASTSCGSDSRRRFVEVTEVWLLVLLGWMEALRWHGWCLAGCDERVYISAKERLPWDGTLFLNSWNTTNPSGVFHLEACYRAKFGNCIGQTIETPIADIHADKLTNQKTKLRRRPIVDIHGTYIHVLSPLCPLVPLLLVQNYNKTFDSIFCFKPSLTKLTTGM